MFLFDDLEFYKNKTCRSSQFISQLWNKYIEADLLMHLGMHNNLMLSIYLDWDNIFLTLTTDYTVIFSKNLDINIKHIITNFEDFSTTININFIKSKEFNIDYDLCLFFHDRQNKKDEGSVEVDCFVKCNLDSYLMFKSDFLSNLSREYQYAIQYNSLGKNIDKLNACHIDAEFEAIYAYMNYKNITLNEALSDLSNKCTLSSVDIKYIRKIYKIVSEGKNE